MLSIGQVAEQLNFKPRAVYEWIKTGKLKAVKVFGSWRIEQSEVDKLKAGEYNG